MDIRTLFPEAIPGPAAWLYSLGPGRVLAHGQERVAEAVCTALDEAVRERPGLPRRVLDIGCGPGWLTAAIARRRPELRVAGVDLSRQMIRIAARHVAGLDNVDLRCENATDLSDANASVAMIVSVGSMHHWREPVRAFDELYRVLVPGGRAWIFDGRDDFDDEEMTDWLSYARHVPGGALGHYLLRIPRAILRTHGFTSREWQTHIPDLARRSRFGGAEIAPFGIYRRLELVRPR